MTITRQCVIRMSMDDEPRVKPLAEVRLTQSVMTVFHACRHAYKLQVLQGIRPRFTPAPLKRGTLVHAALEGALRYQWTAQQDGLWAQMLPQERLDALREHGRAALRTKQNDWLETPEIAPHLTPELRDDAAQLSLDAADIFARVVGPVGIHTGDWTTVADDQGEPYIEYELTAPKDGFAEQGGTIDWLARDVDGNIWLWDWKTSKQIQNEDHYTLQLQAPWYIALLHSLTSLKICGSINYQIRAAVPKTPELNKTKRKGEARPGMSRKAIATTWEVYRQTLIDNGLDPSDYAEMRDKLEETVWQRADRYYRSAVEIRNVQSTVTDTAREMRLTDAYPRNLNPLRCGFCQLREYCTAQLRGHDAAFLRRTTFMAEGEAPFYPEIIVEEDA